MSNKARIHKRTVNKDDYQGYINLVSNPNNKVVVGLGSGGARGLAGNLAFLTLNEDLDTLKHIQEIGGCSAGACIGSIYCAFQGSPYDIVEKVFSLNNSLIDLARKHIIWNILRLQFKRIEGFIWGRRFKAKLKEFLNGKKFEDCNPRFFCVCTDDDPPTKTVFDSGLLVPAVRCSMGIQVVMIPDKVNEKEYCDGGPSEPTPLESLIERHEASGDKRTLLPVCVHFGYPGQLPQKEVRGILSRTVRIIEYTMHKVFKYQLQTAREKGRVILLNPEIYDVNSLDFAKIPKMYQKARDKLEEQLKNVS